MPNGTQLVIPTRADAARELAESHFQIEKGMRRIFRLLRAGGEPEHEIQEPIKLLEVNEDTVPQGIHPLAFPQTVSGGQYQYPVIIVEITPDEFNRLQQRELQLPHGWTIAEEYERPVS
jgi:hypothetical protein